MCNFQSKGGGGKEEWRCDQTEAQREKKAPEKNQTNQQHRWGGKNQWKHINNHNETPLKVKDCKIGFYKPLEKHTAYKKHI